MTSKAEWAISQQWTSLSNLTRLWLRAQIRGHHHLTCLQALRTLDLAATGRGFVGITNDTPLVAPNSFPNLTSLEVGGFVPPVMLPTKLLKREGGGVPGLSTGAG